MADERGSGQSQGGRRSERNIDKVAAGSHGLLSFSKSALKCEQNGF
jgi:hypothetical protein